MAPRRLCSFCMLLLGVPRVTGCCLSSLEALSPCLCHGNLSCCSRGALALQAIFLSSVAAQIIFFFFSVKGFKAQQLFIFLTYSLAASLSSFSMGRQRAIPSVDYVKKVFQRNGYHLGISEFPFRLPSLLPRSVDLVGLGRKERSCFLF